MLERCGLTAVRRELAGSLPIGVARMVEFARAIVDEPEVLLLDEPASGLDETETARLGEQIQSVRAETGCTILLVEHNAGFVMEQSDRVRRPRTSATVLARGSALGGAAQPGGARRLPRRARRPTGGGADTMSEFWNLTFSGLVTGAIYGIMASGLVLTYTTSGIFNFAHGAVAFATAYLYYQLNTGLGVPIVPALDHRRCSCSRRCSGCCSTASCSGGWRRRRCTHASSAPSACSSRCPR